MRIAIALAGVVAFVASAATAAVEVFPATRDSFVLGHSSELGIGACMAGRQRLAKGGNQHFTLMDFDFAAINAAIAADPTATVYLRSWYVSGSGQGDSVQIRAFTGVNDWVEGDQTSEWGWMDWTEDTKQVTRPYAAAEWMWDYGGPGTADDKKVFDVANCTLWDPSDSNVWMEDLPYTQNGNDFTVPMVNGKWMYAVLDAAFLAALTDADLKGIYLRSDTSGNPLGHSRDWGDGSHAPAIIVPEPASLALLGLGGLSLLLRRKRR